MAGSSATQMLDIQTRGSGRINRSYYKVALIVGSAIILAVIIIVSVVSSQTTNIHSSQNSYQPSPARSPTSSSKLSKGHHASRILSSAESPFINRFKELTRTYFEWKYFWLSVAIFVAFISMLAITIFFVIKRNGEDRPLDPNLPIPQEEDHIEDPAKQTVSEWVHDNPLLISIISVAIIIALTAGIVGLFRRQALLSPQNNDIMKALEGLIKQVKESDIGPPEDKIASSHVDMNALQPVQPLFFTLEIPKSVDGEMITDIDMLNIIRFKSLPEGDKSVILVQKYTIGQGSNFVENFEFSADFTFFHGILKGETSDISNSEWKELERLSNSIGSQIAYLQSKPEKVSWVRKQTFEVE